MQTMLTRALAFGPETGTGRGMLRNALCRLVTSYTSKQPAAPR